MNTIKMIFPGNMNSHQAHEVFPDETLDVSKSFRAISSDLLQHIFSFFSSEEKETLVQVNKFWTQTIVDQTKSEMRSSLTHMVSCLLTHLPSKDILRCDFFSYPINRAFEACQHFQALKLEMKQWNKIIISKLGLLKWVDICRLNNKLPGVISLPFCGNLIEDAEIECLHQEADAYSAPYKKEIFSIWKESYFHLSLVTGRLKMMLYLNRSSLQFFLEEEGSQLLPIFLHATNQFDKLLEASSSLDPFEKLVVKNFVESKKNQASLIHLPHNIIDQLSMSIQKIMEPVEDDDLKKMLLSDANAQIQIARKNLHQETQEIA